MESSTAKSKRLTLRAPMDFFTSPQPCSALEDVRRQQAMESAENLIDPADLREGQDWSWLNGRVVGAEFD